MQLQCGSDLGFGTIAALFVKDYPLSRAGLRVTVFYGVSLIWSFGAGIRVFQ